MSLTHLSKFLSLILRHKPEAAFVELDNYGYVEVDSLLEGMKKAKKNITMSKLETIVMEDDKGRYTFNHDKTKIRATQGHSLNITHNFSIATPPKILYHGTNSRFMNDIKLEGLKAMTRHHVHLTAEKEIAQQVGNRRKQKDNHTVILTIDSEKMHQDGIEFCLSENNVWLTKEVKPEYIINIDKI